MSVQFYTPIKLNAVNATRMIIGGGNGVYESLDEGDTLSAIGPGIVVNASGRNPIAYGGVGAEDALYVGAANRVFVRFNAGASLTVSSTYPGSRIVEGIDAQLSNPKVAYVVDSSQVFRTDDAGATWSDISGNLGTLNPGILRSVAFMNGASTPMVAVGSDRGVFAAKGPDFDQWSKFGNNLPNAPVVHLEFSHEDKLMLAGTLGRGAWTVDVP